MAASKRLAEDILEGEEQDCKVVGQRGIAQDNRWEALFRNCHILHEFEHFLIVIASAKTSRNQISWFGLIEARIRHFISNIEKDPTTSVARIWPKPFIRNCTEKTNQLWFVGLEFSPLLIQVSGSD